MNNNNELRNYINIVEDGPASLAIKTAAKNPGMLRSTGAVIKGSTTKAAEKLKTSFNPQAAKGALGVGAVATVGVAGKSAIDKLSGDKLPPSTAQPSSSGTPSTATASKPAAKPASQGAKLTPQEEQELNVLSVDMEKVAKQNPEIAKLLDKYYEVYGK